MGKMSELAQMIDGIRKCTEQLSDIADTLSRLFSGKSEEASLSSMPQPEKPITQVPTLEEVRAVLAEKSRMGHTAAIRTLLQKYGADRLSGVDPANYKSLLADAEGLGNE